MQVFKGKLVPIKEHNYHNPSPNKETKPKNARKVLKKTYRLSELNPSESSADQLVDPSDENYFKNRRERSLILYRQSSEESRAQNSPKASNLTSNSPTSFTTRSKQSKMVERIINRRKVKLLLEYTQKQKLKKCKRRFKGKKGRRMFNIEKRDTSQSSERSNTVYKILSTPDSSESDFERVEGESGGKPILTFQEISTTTTFLYQITGSKSSAKRLPGPFSFLTSPKKLANKFSKVKSLNRPETEKRHSSR